GVLAIHLMHGTREGGAFEAPRVIVSEHDERGAYRRMDFYSLAQLDEARARFAELRPDPLRIPPNAATRAFDRLQEAFEARDWDTYGASGAPAFVLDDRRRFILLTGDRDMFVANGRWLAAQGFSTSHTLLATAGDRLTLEHFRWFGAPDAPDA